MTIKKYEAKEVPHPTMINETTWDVGYYEQADPHGEKKWVREIGCVTQELAEQAATRKNKCEIVLLENMSTAMKNYGSSIEQFAEGARRINEAYRAGDDIFEDVKKEWDRKTYAQLEKACKGWRIVAIAFGIGMILQTLIIIYQSHEIK